MRPLPLLTVAAGTLLITAIAARLAWLCDDAFITLRCVENVAAGHGPCWNAIDRVQTFTHPLWLLLLAAARAVTGEACWTTIVVSLLLAITATAVMLVRAASAAAIATLVVLLAGTRAFGEYATSGLETPLVYLLLVLLAATVARNGDAARRWTRCVLIASLLAATRLDLLLVCVPPVLAAVRGVPWRTLAVRGLLASSPLLAWLCFATLWYGSPLPIAAHAKVFSAGIPFGDVVGQGLAYVAAAALGDPLLLPATALGLVAGWRCARTRWLALGAATYVGYVVAIGGDFMAGRFFVPPFVVAMAVLGPWLAARTQRQLLAIAAPAVSLCALAGRPAWLEAPAGEQPQTMDEIAAANGICDERRFYARRCGVFGAERAWPRFDSSPYDAWPDGSVPRWLWVMDTAGAAGFRAGRSGHVVDALLCDPLLARLPARDPHRWRPGHVQRRLPAGYLATLAHGENVLQHAGLRAYHDALRIVTRAPVLDGERLATTWRLLRGDFDAGLRAYVDEHYHSPPRVVVQLESLPSVLAAGTYWFDDHRLHVIDDGGVAVPLGAARAVRSLRIQAAGVHQLAVRFVRDGAVVGGTLSQPPPGWERQNPFHVMSGLRTDEIRVPPRVPAFDTLWLDAGVPDGGTPTPPVVLGAITFDG